MGRNNVIYRERACEFFFSFHLPLEVLLSSRVEEEKEEEDEQISALKINRV